MLENFYGWIRTIAACLIFMSLVLRLLPEEKNIKYIRHFMGMVLVLVVLAPLGKLFRLEEAFSGLERAFERAGARSDFEAELSLMGDTYTETVVHGYEEELAAQALRFLETKGYGGVSVRVGINIGQDFGQVERMEVLPFEKTEEGKENGQIAIEKKKVQILSEEQTGKSYLEEAENGELKRLLSEEFSIPEEAVRIVR